MEPCCFHSDEGSSYESVHTFLASKKVLHSRQSCYMDCLSDPCSQPLEPPTGLHMNLEKELVLEKSIAMRENVPARRWNAAHLRISRPVAKGGAGRWRSGPPVFKSIQSVTWSENDIVIYSYKHFTGCQGFYPRIPN